MTRRTIHRLGSLAAGALAAAGIWALDVDPILAGAIGVSVLVVGLLVARLVRGHLERTADPDWRTRRWVWGFIAFLVLVAFNGVLAVPVSFEYSVALHALVGLAGLVGFFTGKLDELSGNERDANDGAADGAGTAADPTSD